MRKIWKLMIVSLCSVFFLCIGGSMPVQAASWQTADLEYNEDTKVGNLVFTYVYDSIEAQSLYVKKNGKQILLASGRSLNYRISTNGKQVFYLSSGSVYRVSVNAKNRKKILSSAEYFCGYYDGKLYYSKGLEPGSFYSYDLKTGKKKLLVRDSCSLPREQYKNCFLLGHLEGDFGPDTLLVYNVKKGKAQKLDNMYPYKYALRGNYIYYVEFVKFNRDSWYYDHTVAVKRWNINTFKTETVIKKIKAHTVSEFTKNSITYVDANGKTKTRKF